MSTSVQEALALGIVGLAVAIGGFRVFRAQFGGAAALWIMKHASFRGSSKFAMWLRGQPKSGCGGCECPKS